MVRNDVWHDAGMGDGYLCVGCVELRLGRRLEAHDFTPWPINEPSPWDTPRLASRKSGSTLYEP
jgi:hypothetical protein